MLDKNLLNEVRRGFQKSAFVPGDPNAGADPAAGGMPMDPAAMGGMPMDPAAMGGMPVDPAAMGEMPMDPAAMGGMPVDPAAMGGMPPAPPPGLDPAMAGMLGGMPPAAPADPAAAAGESPAMITMTVDQFLKFLKQIMALAGKQDTAPAPAQTATDTSSSNASIEAKLDALLNYIR